MYSSCNVDKIRIVIRIVNNIFGSVLIIRGILMVFS